MPGYDFSGRLCLATYICINQGFVLMLGRDYIYYVSSCVNFRENVSLRVKESSTVRNRRGIRWVQDDGAILASCVIHMQKTVRDSLATASSLNEATESNVRRECYYSTIWRPTSHLRSRMRLGPEAGGSSQPIFRLRVTAPLCRV